MPRAAPIPLTFPQQPRRSNDEESRPRASAQTEGSGSYTTVCVRMCDGFYFPISHKVQRGRFYRDADVCRSRCGMADARLFYHSSTGPNADMNSAVDLTGRSYAALPIAFLHRKRLVSGCACQPAPWSEASASRHQRYAAAENRSGSDAAASRSRTASSDSTVVAGNYDKPAPTEAGNTDAGNNAGIPALEAVAELENAQSGQPTLVAAAAPRRPVRATAAQIGPARVTIQSLPRKAATRALPRPVASAPQRKPKGTTIASNTKLTWPGDAR